MKAITYPKYGSPEVLELQDVEVPVPADGEVLIRVRSASANPRDWHLLRGVPYAARVTFGVRRPRHFGLGSDVAGQVEAVGSDVTRFRPGDEVFADVLTGGFAEYTTVPQDLVGLKPANLTFEEAAAVPLAAVTALQGLRDGGRIQAGHKVLIIGAGGGVGIFAVQLAKWFGAEVTGVCSTSKVDLVRSLGADHVIDYTREDFTRSSQRYELIFQLAGTQSPGACRRALTSNGTLILSSGESSGPWIGPIGRILKALVLSPLVRQRLVPFEAKRSSQDLEFIKALIEAGTLKPVIDRTYPLSECAEAIRYLENGHARGKILISV